MRAPGVPHGRHVPHRAHSAPACAAAEPEEPQTGSGKFIFPDESVYGAAAPAAPAVPPPRRHPLSVPRASSAGCALSARAAAGGPV